MKQIIVTGDVAYGASKAGGNAAISPSDLAEGSLGVYKHAANGRGVTLLPAAGAAAELGDVKMVFLAVGTADGCERTDDIQRNLGIDFRASEYADDVTMQIIIGVTGDAGTGLRLRAAGDRKRGDEYIVRVEDIREGYQPYAPKRVYTYTSMNDAEDDATVLAGIRDAINDGLETSFVTATKAADNTSFTLTAKDAESIIRVALDGGLYQASRKVSRSPLVGQGTAKAIQEIEKSYAGWQGFSDPINAFAPQLPSKVVAGETYDTYFIKHEFTGKSFDGINGTHTRRKFLVVAIPDGAASGASFEAIMADVINITGNTAAPEPAEDTVAEPVI